MKLLSDYKALKQSLEKISTLEGDRRYDKKYWTVSKTKHDRCYRDFGPFFISYFAGEYGSSSVSERLFDPSEEFQKEFSEFICRKTPALLTEFLDTLHMRTEADARKRIGELAKQLEDLKKEYGIKA